MSTRKKYLKRCILPCAALLAALPAQTMAGEGSAPGLSGEVTAKFFLFDYTGGAGDSRTRFLERYDYRKGWGGDNDSGIYLDLDMGLAYSDGMRDVFTLERRGDGQYNHAGRARFNAEQLGFFAYYSHFRSATNGIEYLFSPGQVPGGTDSTYGAGNHQAMYTQFNDQSDGRTNYKVDRTTYGGGIDFKPGLLGNGRSASLNYDGYTRDGNRFATFVAGGSDFAPNGATRWQGYTKAVDENMDRGSVSITLSPGGLFQLAYDGSLEKFEDQVKALTFDEYQAAFLAADGITTTGGNKQLHFAPDSTLLTNAIRLSNNYANTSWSAGYAKATLEQDTFTNPQVDLGYTIGKISTDNGYFTVSHRLNPQIGLEGFVKYQKRDNDSSFPVVGLIETVTAEKLGVRIDRIETWQYGLAATIRSAGLKTTFTPGWQHEDIDRDLTFHDTGITDAVSLYNEDSKSDEIYLKVVSRPIQGLTLRLTPSYTWADKTGLVTEPEDSLKVKAQGSYAAANGMLVNGYYNYENRDNGNNTVTDKAAPLATYNQNIDNTMQSAGLSLHMAPAERVTAFASLDWTQNAFESAYFSTSSRRFEATPVFTLRDRSEYDVDTYHLSLGGDWQASDLLKLSGGYTYTRAKGDVASGEVDSELASTIDGEINNTLHSFMLGAGYTLKPGVDLRTSYIYDYYTDKEYRNLDGSTLSGGVHTVMVGFAFQL